MSTVYHKLSESSLVQNWSQASLLSSPDDWSAVASIQGFSNVQFGSGVGTDARAFVFDSTNPDVATDVLISPSQFDLDAGTNGGVAEFQDFGIVALGGSANASVPNLVLYLDTTDLSVPVTLNFDVQDLDSTSNDTTQQLNVQYQSAKLGIGRTCQAAISRTSPSRMRPRRRMSISHCPPRSWDNQNCKSAS